MNDFSEAIYCWALKFEVMVYGYPVLPIMLKNEPFVAKFQFIAIFYCYFCFLVDSSYQDASKHVYYP